MQALQISIAWKQCAELPIKLSEGRATIIADKVYYGGGDAYSDEYIVYCYDLSQDKWTNLPPLPVRWFGLGQVNGKLVTVGGEKKANYQKTNEVYTYDERSRKWKQTVPPMPTARWSPGVLSLQSILVVAGGNTLSTYTEAVEIFKPDTSQWHRTDPLPTICLSLSLVSIGSTCYALGGYQGPSLNQALYASVDDLLGNSVPANKTTHIGNSDIPCASAWKTLPSTPTYQPAAAVLVNNLLAIGGRQTSQGGAYMKEVYLYSPSTNSWIYISDLPAPRTLTAVVALSSTEILVIGGVSACHGAGFDVSMNTATVYKGTLHLKL